VGLCRGGRGDDVRANLPSHLLQWGELLLIDEVKLSNKVVEVFVACVDVRLSPDAHDPVKVVDIHMHKHPVQPGQDLLALRLETLGEGYVSGDRKQLLIIYLSLDPVHEKRDVLRGG